MPTDDYVAAQTWTIPERLLSNYEEFFEAHVIKPVYTVSPTQRTTTQMKTRWWYDVTAGFTLKSILDVSYDQDSPSVIPSNAKFVHDASYEYIYVGYIEALAISIADHQQRHHSVNLHECSCHVMSSSDHLGLHAKLAKLKFTKIS